MELPPFDRLESLDEGALAELRRRLDASGYAQGVIDRAETSAPSLFHPLRLPFVRWSLRRMQGADALLARVLAYDDSAPWASLVDALGADLSATLLEAGLFAREGDLARALFRLAPERGLWILSDQDLGGDCVIGPGATTLILERLVPESFTGRALDLGCGSGVLALLLAQAGGEVIATDINERAARMTRWSARLNQLTVDVRVGDLFAPVEGERFDLILSQPPFIALPDGIDAVTYMHGGRRGDELALRIAAELPRFLADEGQAALLFDTPELAGTSLERELRERLGGTSVGQLTLLAPGPHPDHLALAYAFSAGQSFSPEVEALALRYRDHIESLGARRFHRALFLLHGAVRGIAMQLQVRGLPDAAVLARLWRSVAISAAAEEELLKARLRPVPEAHWLETRTRPDLELDPSCQIRFDSGWYARDLEVPFTTVVLLAALARSDRLSDAVARYESEIGAAPGEARVELLRFVRDGLRRGVLEVS